MSYTLLDTVQLVLSSMDSDEVNDINDTVESQQVVNIARTVFDEIINRFDFPEHNGLFELTASGDNTQPVKMTVPSNVMRIDWVKYNNKLTTDTYPNYQEVKFKPLDTFIQDQNDRLRNESTNVALMTLTIDDNTLDFMYETDKFPQYYTSFDDDTLIFDSVNLDEDTTLQKNKTMCSGWLKPQFTIANTFVPPFDEQVFSLYLNEVKAQAFAELKQTQNQQAELKARRQLIRAQRDKRKIPQTERGELDALPNYGRK